MRTLTVNAALRLRSALAGEIAARTKRMLEGNVYRENEEPAFDFKTSYEERKELVRKMIELQSEISLSNARTLIDFGGGRRQISITEALKALDEIKSEIALLEKIPSQARKERIVCGIACGFSAPSGSGERSAWLTLAAYAAIDAFDSMAQRRRWKSTLENCREDRGFPGAGGE